MRILIVDDEANIRATLRVALEAMGHLVDEADSATSALDRVRRGPCDAAFVDLRLGRESGLDLLDRLIKSNPRIAVVLITAYASLDTAIEAIRRGAFDYLPKPFTPAQVRVVLERMVRVRGLRDRVEELEERVRAEVPEIEPESTDPAMCRVEELARRVAPTDAVILIRGENGTGKGVLARSLHAQSRRAEGPFVTVSAPSLNPGLLESELFGHAKGSYTGADRDVAGKVASAEAEPFSSTRSANSRPRCSRSCSDSSRIANTSGSARSPRDGPTFGSSPRPTATSKRPSSQARSAKTCSIASTSSNSRSLRYDFAPTSAPWRIASSNSSPIRPAVASPGSPRKPARRLARHSWPGNIRELRNAVERAAILAAGPEIGAADLPDRIALPKSPEMDSATIEVGGRIRLDRLEAEHIRRVLGRTSSLEEAAHVLGIDPSTLFRKRKRLGL